jgi:hypothetical protein
MWIYYVKVASPVEPGWTTLYYVHKTDGTHDFFVASTTSKEVAEGIVERLNGSETTEGNLKFRS